MYPTDGVAETHSTTPGTGSTTLSAVITTMSVSELASTPGLSIAGGTPEPNSTALPAVVGFLTCLALVETALIVWLLLDRKRLKQELYRVTMFSVGIPAGTINQAGDFPELASDSPRCPAISIIPALARFHSRQLSCGASEANLISSPENTCLRPHMGSHNQAPRTRSQSAEEIMARPQGDMGEYAFIRNSDVLGSVQRGRGRAGTYTPDVPEIRITQPVLPGAQTEQKSTQGSGNDENGARSAQCPTDKASFATDGGASFQANSHLLRRNPNRHGDVGSGRYSLVRHYRLQEDDPTDSPANRTPVMSCEIGNDLLREISTVTDIHFEQDNPRRSDLSAGNKSKTSSGVYEDVQISRSSHRQISVTSDELTEISDMSSTSSAEDLTDSSQTFVDGVDVCGEVTSQNIQMKQLTHAGYQDAAVFLLEEDSLLI